MFHRIGFDKILPYSKYLILVWFGTVGFPYLYFTQIERSVNRVGAALCYCAVIIAFNLLMNRNRCLIGKRWGKSVIGIITVELFFLLLFSQKHILAAIMIIVILGVISILFYRLFMTSKPERRNTVKKRKICRNAAAASVCYIAVFVLVVPSIIGFIEEYISPPSNYNIRSYSDNAYVNEEGGQSISEKPDSEILEQIKHWDELPSDSRMDLLSRISAYEADYLGMGKYFSEIKITAQAMEDYQLGGYNDASKTIRINIDYLNRNSATDVIFTQIHEVFHVFQNYLIDSLDYNSPLVQNNYYFRTARLWRSNTESYINGVLHPEEYASQPLEADANTYASERISFYFSDDQS